MGERHVSFLLPVWVGKDRGNWSTFGGGCALNDGGDAQDYCLVGWVLTRQVLPDLTLGAEIYHQTADTRGGKSLTGMGTGLTYDLTDTYHLMASYGPGLAHQSTTDRYSWYAALLFT